MSWIHPIGTTELDDEFRSLVSKMIGHYNPENGIGYMTTSIYDTAWVACIRRPDGKQLFPEALHVILEAQDDNGAWSEANDLPSNVLSSLAALFTLRHCQKTWKLTQLDDRIENAQRQLEAWLQNLDHVESGGVGFEVIVPCLLDLLAKENISFQFPAREKLFELKRLKLAKIPRDLLYNSRTPLLHSLEAFFDDPEIDYDRFARHKVRGSLMASPSSTAAYMMRSSTWDDEAEAYLYRAFRHGVGAGSGTFPSAFPSTIFETNWVLSTTLSAGFDFEMVEDVCKLNFTKIYEESGASEGQCVAFSPGLEPDLDDTARMSITASLRELPQISSRMIVEFETPFHMETYKRERNPSFSANCNALLAMLVEKPSVIAKSRSTIDKVTRFLCRTWAATSSLPTDKWNVSPHYAPMLMAETFAKLIEASRQCDGQLVPAELLEQDVTRALVQYTIRTLQSQNQNGSWGTRGPREETSYAIIGLASVSCIPFLQSLSGEIRKAIKDGSQFLQQSKIHQEPERLWVEKVLYGSSVLSSAYVLSALRISLQLKSDQSRPAPVLESTVSDRGTKDRESLMLLRKLPMLQDCPPWILKGSAIEAQTFIPFLESIRGRVFTREGFGDDKYFKWIPFIWSTANNSLGGCMASANMADMMAISIINFQVDEFMESIVASVSDEEQSQMSAWIARKSHTEAKQTTQNSAVNPKPADGVTDETALVSGDPNSLCSPKLITPLNAFFGYIGSHLGVQSASQHDRDKLFGEIPKFFDAHLQQNKDSASLYQQRKKSESGMEDASYSSAHWHPQADFQSWVRSTAADHTSCPYSFAYAVCISSRGGKDFFSSLQQKYIAEDVCRHLATLCRLYNDAGSIRRDRDECNLNSADFAALHSGLSPSLDSAASLRDRVLALASYERTLLDAAYGELEKISSPDVMEMLRIFIRVTDMFGEIYILKDLASRKLATNNK